MAQWMQGARSSGENEIIGQIKDVAPPGRDELDDCTLGLLRDLTRALIMAKDGAAEEHARFLAIRQRELCMPEVLLAERLDGATILVTGGTGCIGSTLITQLAARAGRVVSVSRGVTEGYPRHALAEYHHADIRNRAAIDELIGSIKPDLVFHVAAQRDPGIAETEVHRTVTTNVLGTRNVLTAAALTGFTQVVTASTGKALRPYSPDMYTASKRAAEWVASMVSEGSGMLAASGMLVSSGRFTHVLDNSIIYQRILSWADGPDDGFIRLHSPDIVFYVQSALESAQLLMLASLGARRGEFRIHAIGDLSWPVCLIDLALAVLASAGSKVPVYLSGYDQGYEEIPFPGLYDPATAGDVSPLLNAFEACATVSSQCPRVDAFRVDMATSSAAVNHLRELEVICARTKDSATVREAMNELSWLLLDCTLRAAPAKALARSAEMARRERSLSADHQRILMAIEKRSAERSAD